MAIEILTKRVLILILILFYYYCFYRVRMVGGGWALKVCLHVLYWTKVVDANYRCSRSHRQGWSLRWFLSNCFRNENVLKLSKLEIYDMLIVKTKKKLGSPNSFRRSDKHYLPPFFQYGAILTLLRVTTKIVIAQPLLNFLTSILP